MQLSFFISTVLYLALILLIHYKIRDKFPNLQTTEQSQQSQQSRQSRQSQQSRQSRQSDDINYSEDTIISLDDVDKDIDSKTIQDLKRFLATPELDITEKFSPIVEHSELDNYFDQPTGTPDEAAEIPTAGESGESCDSGAVAPAEEAFENIAAFDDFGGYQNFAQV